MLLITQVEAGQQEMGRASGMSDCDVVFALGSVREKFGLNNCAQWRCTTDETDTIYAHETHDRKTVYATERSRPPEFRPTANLLVDWLS